MIIVIERSMVTAINPNLVEALKVAESDEPHRGNFVIHIETVGDTYDVYMKSAREVQRFLAWMPNVAVVDGEVMEVMTLFKTGIVRARLEKLKEGRE